MNYFAQGMLEAGFTKQEIWNLIRDLLANTSAEDVPGVRAR